ncbi:hypothetical protein Cme02nite_54640 [Catellatospora methionotrophica]|uniref:Heparinase II/III-like protein n=1 Tax=Catellatospora methionotrophica TaxID=121620 RepID=A0A8J3PHA9_9ACTN|nr:heparinase II/III family protein [Catellatospora methionotrophica]GIG17132.1 hypothetical protein Cme02nite_54640 [Catellatospora methionotrophica]
MPALARPAGELTSLLRDIRAAATGEPLPDLGFSAYRDYFDTGNRIRYERRYFRRRARLAAQAAQALLDPDTDLGPLADTLWSVCDEYTWALPAHVRHSADQDRGPEQCLDLFAAETAHTVAETVAALGDRLDRRVGDRVRSQVRRRVFEPYLDARPLNWEGHGNNWEAVCAGATGLAALALLHDSPADAAALAAMLDRSRRAMDRYLGGFGDDGGCAEGVDYWVYGFGYFVYFAEALREHTGHDLLDSAKVAQIAAFPHRVALGGGAYVPFSDASERPWLPAGLLTRLAERFGTPPARVVPSLHDDHCYRWGHLSRTLAWFRPLPAPAPTGNSSYLPDLAWVVHRGRTGFAAKGGNNDEPHNHNDLGHFVLHTHGVSVLDDLGAGEYTAGYFGPGRHAFLHPSARGHSVPVIDGQAQLPGPDRAAKVLHHADDGGTVSFDLDLTGAYQVDGLRSLVRRFRWSDGRLELTDEIDAARDLPVEELFISRREPVLATGSADWDGLATLTHDCPQAAVSVEPTSDHQAQPDRVYRLTCTTLAPAGRSSHRFVFELA